MQHYFPLLFHLPLIYCLFIDYKPFLSSLYCSLSTIHLVSASAPAQKRFIKQIAYKSFCRNKKSGSRLLPWARLSLFFFVFCCVLLHRQFDLISLKIQNAGLVIPVPRGTRPADHFIARRSQLLCQVIHLFFAAERKGKVCIAREMQRLIL